MKVSSLMPLGEIVTIAKGKKHTISDSPTNIALRLLSIDDLRNNDLIRFTDDRNGVDVNPADILIAWDGANAGTIGYGKAGLIGSTIARLRFKKPNQIYPPYIGKFLQSKFSYLRKTATGATIPHVSRAALENIQIPLPPLDDQKRIAHLLGKVGGLIAQRKQHLQQLDDLLKSVFLEMFGDPVRNEKGWEIEILSGCLADPPTNGLYKPNSSYGRGIKIVRIDSFYNGYVQNIENLKKLEVSDSEYKKYEIKVGDILVNRVNSMEYLGKLGVVPEIKEPMVYESNIMRFRLAQEKICPSYLMFVWRFAFIRSQIVSRAKKAVNQASINQKDIGSLQIPIPPLILQNQFAAIVEKVEGLKDQYRQSFTDLESLYGALSQKAFRGELDLSRVELPEVQEMDSQEDKDSFALQEPRGVTALQQTQMIGAVIDVLVDHKDPRGEMMIAKYLYLLTVVVGVSTGFHFKRWHLGPYDLAIKDRLSDGTYFQKGGKEGWETFSLLRREELFRNAPSQVAEIRTHFPELSKALSRWNAVTPENRKVELVATVLKCVQDSGKQDLASVREEMRRWEIDFTLTGHGTKAEKFSEAEVRACLDFLRERGWM